MSTSATATLLRHLRQWAAGRGDDPHSDRDLLRRFVAHREEDAFAALVRRHGPMVWSVCLRILPQLQDAEDAFQATFLVLLRRAATHSWRDSIGGWLHGVATRIALRLRADAARRAVEIPRAKESILVDPLEQVTARELFAAFDEELARLPERYRAALVLCCLQGKTQEETAQQLGCSLSTIRRRLERGRHLLHVRLTGRGLELPAAVGAVLVSKEATAAVPPLLRVSVMQLVGGSVSARVAVLAEGVVPAAVLTPMKTTALVLFLSALAAGAGVTASHFLARKAPQSETAAKEQSDTPATEKTERTDLYGDPLPPRALARMGTVRLRHLNLIGNVAYSRDGKTLAAAGEGGFIRIYDPATGRTLRQFAAQAHQYPSLAFAPDSKTLASLGTNLIQFWDVESGKELHRFDIGATDRRHYSTVPIVFSPDGRLLASVGPENSVHIWEAKSGKDRFKLSGHQSSVCCLAFSPDGKSILSASDRGGEQAGSVIVWKAATGEEVRKISLHQPGSANTVAQPTPLCFSPDGKTLAFAAWQTVKRKIAKGFVVMQAHAVTLLDLETGRAIRKMEPMLGRLKAASFSPDGKIITAMNDADRNGEGTSKDELSRIKGWETATGKLLFNFPAPTTSTSFWGGAGTLLAFAPDGKNLAAASGSSLHLWDLSRGRERLEKPETHQSKVLRVAFSPDGRTLATASSDHTLALWDAATGKQRLLLRGHEGQVWDVAFSADGKLLASASHSMEQAVRLWDAATGKQLRRFEVPSPPTGDGGSFWGIIIWIAFTANGKNLAACGNDGTIRRWDVGSGKELFNQRLRALPALPKGHEAAFHFVHDPVFTSDGRTLAFSSAKTMYIVDVSAGQSLFQFERDDFGHTVLALSPDGKTLLRRANKSIRLVETVSGKVLHKLNLPEGEINAAFSPDGRIVAVSGDTQAAIRLFDVPTGKELLRLRGHDAPVDSLAFSPDGTRLASGQWDSTALIWEISVARRNLPKSDLIKKDLERLWADLRAADAARAYAALWTLVTDPEKTVPFFKQHLHPVPRVAEDRLRRLIADLDADEFVRREQASQELAKLGSEAEPALRKALESKPALETRRRVESLLKELVCQTEITPDALRQLRAIQVLEQIGSSEARNILKSLAQGAPAAPATRDAAATMQRIDHRGSAP